MIFINDSDIICRKDKGVLKGEKMLLSMQLEQVLSLKLNQFQMQSLNILEYNNCELEEFLQNEFMENPMMEYQESVNQPPVLTGNAAGYKETNLMDLCDEPIENPKQFFFEQLNQELYTEREKNLMEYIIDCMEDSGLLLVPVEDISQEQGVSVEECEKFRQILMQLEPAGVFAMSLEECLLEQLKRKNEYDEIIDGIVKEHLQDVADGNIAAISRKFGCSTVDVKKYIRKIQKLYPRPFCQFTGDKTEYIVPDLIVKQVEDVWEIKLNDQWIENYSLNDYYLGMLHKVKDSELKEYFQKKYLRCKYILTAIESRRETIVKITQAILNIQKEFFLTGKNIKQMTMQQIASDLKIHGSTVSRAVKGKYIQYPGGTMALKEMFASAYSFENQGKTVEDIKEEIKKVIRMEPLQKPYSDQKIAKILEERNIKISRRTVAKYREELKIKGMFERKVSTV